MTMDDKDGIHHRIGISAGSTALENTKDTDEQRIAEEHSIKRIIRAARVRSGEADDPGETLTAEEERILAEIRSEHRRPTPDEIKDAARKLARDTR